MIHTLLSEADEEGLLQFCEPMLPSRSSEDRRMQVVVLDTPNRVGEQPIVNVFKHAPDIDWILRAAAILETGGANMGAKDLQNSTVLHYAAARGDPKLFDICLGWLEKPEYELDINDMDCEEGEYTSGQWVHLQQDKRYATDEEKRLLDAQSKPVLPQNNTVSHSSLTAHTEPVCST